MRSTDTFLKVLTSQRGIVESLHDGGTIVL